MRRFRFPLDPALQLRNRLEEQAQMELAESRRRLELQQQGLEEIERQLDHQNRLRSGMQQSSVDLASLAALDPYQEELERAGEIACAAVRAAEEAVERSLAALQQRRVDREALERLRDRRRAEHRQAELGEEQRAMDEAGVLRWRRE